MLALLGSDYPRMPRELKDRIKSGRELLVRITKVDFEYDPAKWHE